MRRSALALVLATVALIAPAAQATTAPIVDAGTTLTVDAGATFTLEGAIEGAEGTPTIAWTAPDGCTLSTPGSLSTEASCDTTGTKTFGLSATASNGTAHDDVRIVVVRLERRTLLTADGDSSAGLPDEVTPLGGGAVDGASTRVAFDVPSNTSLLSVELGWVGSADLDLRLERPNGRALDTTEGRTRIRNPESVSAPLAEPGTWHAIVDPVAGPGVRWTVRAVADVIDGNARVPTVLVPHTSALPGETVELRATTSGGTEPYELAWETDAGSIAFDDGTGETLDHVFAGGVAHIRVRVRDAAGLEAVSDVFVRERAAGSAARSFTVVAVVDSGFSPYHEDYFGWAHPWNTDEDTTNDFDFYTDPASYLTGYPGATPVNITVPTTKTNVSTLRSLDDEQWRRFALSSRNGAHHLYWFPGTKIVGAMSFYRSDGEEFFESNSSHGTRSAASAVGNVHGTCPECLVVMIRGGSSDGLAWAVQQPWIDIVTNSYGAGTSGRYTSGATRDNIYFGAPVDLVRDAVEDGSTVVFSAGNGFLNAFDVPMPTYWSSEKGPDWIVTVGAVSPRTEQDYMGHGKPVDVSSIGSGYPSTGGTTTTGTGTHSGTSNAAPVTAGALGKVLQHAREILGDTSAGHADGVVAEGAPIVCGAALPACALGDGVLTRAELEDLVLDAVLPSPAGVALQTIPTGPAPYLTMGHGVISGLMNGAAHWNEEFAVMIGMATGAVATPERPEGEDAWFVADSLCRQRAWGRWSGGEWTGQTPAFDPLTDGPAIAAFNACSALPDDAFRPLRP